MDNNSRDGGDFEHDDTRGHPLRRLELPGSKRVPARTVAVYFLGILLIVATASVILSYLLHRKDVQVRRLVFERQSNALAHLVNEVSDQHFRSIIADLVFLARDRQLEAVLNWNEPIDIATLQSQWVLFATAKGVYDQIRFIDPSGREAIRVNYNNGLPYAVHDDELQDKSGRYYVKRSLALKPGQIYVSPLDLNREHGTIERPYKPVIRFVMPLHNGRGKLLGLLAVNYLADDVLSRLRAAASETGSNLMILNTDGYWIVAPKKSDEWGFLRAGDNDTGPSFARRFPDAWPIICENTGGQFYNDNGLFTFSTFAFPHDRASMDDNATNSGLTWKMVSYIPDKDIIQASTVIVIARLFRGHAGYIALLALVSGLLAVAVARKRVTELALVENEAMLSRLIANMPDCVCFKDVRGRWIVSNEANLQLFGLEGIDYRGLTDLELSAHSSINQNIFLANAISDAEVLKDTGVIRTEEIFSDADGENETYDIIKVPVFDAHMGAIGTLFLGRNITDRKHAEEELKRHATTDALTGVFNRRTGLVMLENEIKRARRTNTNFVVGYVDINNLKHVNDTFGHTEGDTLIKAGMNAIDECLRESDIIARVGGDEFIIIFSDCDLECAEITWKRVEDRFVELNNEMNKPYRISVSRGFTMFDPASGDTTDTLLAAADEEMYRNKVEGRRTLG